MASSPEIGPPPENKPMGSPPPFPSARPPQESPQPTDADPLEPAQSDRAKSTPPPPHPGNAVATSPAPAPPPTEGTTREAGALPSLSAPPALEGAEPEKPTSPLPPPPPPPVEACPKAATTDASPSPSPQIAADTPPPSTPSSPPASPPGSLPDASPSDSAATVPEDASRLLGALESMNANRRPTAPSPPKPPPKSGPEGLLPQQHPRPPCPKMLPGCDNSQPPSPRRPLADIAHALPDAAETDAIAVTSAEPGASSACNSEAEGSFEVPMSIPLSSPTTDEPGSPEMAPPGFEKHASSWPPLPSPNLSVKTARSLLNSATMEEPSNSLTVLEAMDSKINTAPGLPPPSSGSLQQPLPRSPSPDTPPPGFENFKLSRPPPPNETTYTSSDFIATNAETVEPEEAVLPVPALEAIHVETDSARSLLLPLESKVEGLLKQPLLRSTTPVAQSEPCSPEMAPPGFENIRSSRQPVSLPQSGTAHIMPDAAATEPLAVMLEEVAGPRPVLEAMDVDMHAIHPLLVPLKSGMEGSLQEPLPRPPSPIVQDVTSSPDMGPPGFENCKSPQLMLPSLPLAHTAYTFNDPAPEAIYVETDSSRNLLPLLENKVEGLLKQPLLRSTTPVAQSESCSPEMAPPGFEIFISSWQPLSTPLSGTAHIMPDSAATEPLAVKLEEAAGPRPALEAMDMDMYAIHPLLGPLESGMEESLQEPQPRPPSPTVLDVPGLPDMAPPGFENFNSLQLLLPSPPMAQTAYTFSDPATTEVEHVSEEAAQPLPAPKAMDVNMETSLPQQLHQLLSPKEKSTASSLEMVPSGNENLQLLPLPPLLPEIQTPDVLADVAATESVIVALGQVHDPVPVLGTIEEGTSPILSPALESSSEGLSRQLEPQMNSVKTHAVDTQPDAPTTNNTDLKSDETALSPPGLQAIDTNMDSAIAAPLLSGNGAEGLSPQRQHQPSSPSMQVAPCSSDDLDLLPPPPPPFLNKEMGQMVCGSCRELIAYPRGAVHVRCAGCQTINLVLEAHEVGNVHCGRCGILLMYPFGSPAVKCSSCLFITEIEERNVRPRISVEQVASPHPPELVNQG